MTKRLLQVLHGEATSRPPFWFMRQAGRYLPEYRALRERQPDFLRFCYTPELAIEATLQPLSRFAPDAAILFSDILVVADALGAEVRFVEGQGPVLTPLRTTADIDALRCERLAERLAPVYSAVRGIRAALPADVALIGFAGAPWTVALYMVEGRGGSDGAAVRAWAYAERDGFARLIDRLVEATVEYLQEQVVAGAEALQLFDSWAGLLAEEEFVRWVIAPTREIVRRLRAGGVNVPVIGFPRGAGVLTHRYARETGVQAIGLDAGIPLDWAAETLQPVCAVQGNLDNQLLRAGGPSLAEATRRILKVLAPRPFIFNLGHGILPDTSPEHVATVAELVRTYPECVR